MAAGELLACSKFYVSFDGLDDLIVSKVSGVSIELQTAGDQNPFGVTKGGKAAIQATVTGVQNSTVTVEYVGTVDDNRLFKWYEDSHSQPTTGGGSGNKGELKTGSIVLYNQAGEEAARWDMTGVMPKTYKTSCRLGFVPQPNAGVGLRYVLMSYLLCPNGHAALTETLR